METMNNVDNHLLWAFAVDVTRPRSVRRRHLPSPQRNLHRYQIMSCSPRLKAIGVQTGMRFDEAKRRAPGMRVIVTNR
ncbi:MAG: hypothetical protein JWM37_98 [Candidatus Saccharibacteria bacterium]|nr:hypothetical protein [Candidatus Saccharibacteria bacterium]